MMPAPSALRIVLVIGGLPLSRSVILAAFGSWVSANGAVASGTKT
jgi:hypothetical protein